MMYDPVFQNDEDGKWYFWDETWSNTYGPYDSEDKARVDLDWYVKFLNGELDEQIKELERRIECESF